MVAELAAISTLTVVDGRRPPPTTIERPKWIQTATREPIYSILDSDETVPQTPPETYPTILDKVVVITAVKKDAEAQRQPPEQNVEDESTLYSVVNKSAKEKVRPPLGRDAKSSSSDEETIRPIHVGEDFPPGEPGENWSQLEELVEVREWLRDTPAVVAMYSDRTFDYENPWLHEPRQAGPKGVVGLVGPYRVYRNPNERREYMLQEEELVEESTISEQDGHRFGAKWRVDGGDDETEAQVPDIRDLPGLEDFAETNEDRSGCVGGRPSRGEERPIDVPDTMSAASSTRDMGERKLASRSHEFLRPR